MISCANTDVIWTQSVYPTAVLIIVSQQKSLEDHVFAFDAQSQSAARLSGQLATIEFGDGRATLGSSGARISRPIPA
jgi:hypothetical protein